MATFRQFTTSYKNSSNKVFLLNVDMIIYIAECGDPSDAYEGTKCIIEYQGGEDGSQLAYVTDEYSEIKRKLNI